jgi:hypothetical protein
MEQAGRNATRQATAGAAPWIVVLARVGYAAKAVLYATIGVLAAKAALGAGGRTTDTRGAMGTMLDAPFGRALLGLMALGLFGYAAWRVVEAIADPERRGTDAKGLAVRASFVARGILHAGLAVSALRVALHNDRSGGGGSGQKADSWTARAMDLGGEWLVWAIALGVGGYGLYQIYRAYAAKLSKQLDLGRMSAEAGRWVVTVSRIGIAARGVVFGMIGLLLARAASSHEPGRAGGIADALGALAGLGRWPFAAVALGLVAYGMYELLNARYRRITVQ